MDQLAVICKDGLESFNIDKILLPIVTHRKNINPAAFMKNYLKKSKNMYNRSANDSSFVEKCVNLHNSTN